MRAGGMRVHLWAKSVAMTSIMVGVALTGIATATAAPGPSKFAIVKFLPSLNEVTLTVPTPPCRKGPPGCVWQLWVNEPFAPGAPVLGTATGTSGVLTVTYPSTVCGTVQGDASVALQADVSVGGLTFRHLFGHRLTIQCTTTTATADPQTAPPTGPTTQLPFAGVISSSPTDPGTTATAARTTAAVVQLPFTGLNVRPLAIIGSVLVLLGLMLVTRREHQRRLLDWFLGL